MKKYSNRTYRGFSKGLTIAYLTTAILWGVSCCAFGVQRAEIKDDYSDGHLSHESYIYKLRELGKKEDVVLKTIGGAFGVTFVTDVITNISGAERE